MKQVIFFIVFAVLISHQAFSQDKIIKNNGDKIECKILNQDSTSVYFSTEVNGRNVNTFMNKSQIQSIEYHEEQPVDPSYLNGNSLGLGMGLDYGGFGVNALFYPSSNLGFFVGAGYAVIGISFNGGIKYRFISKEKFRVFVPYVEAMYGYNAVIAVKNKNEYNKFFYGPTLGLGLDIKFKPQRKGYWTFALLIPIRSSDAKAYMDDLEKNHYVKFENELPPVLISFGYRMTI